MPKNYMFYIGKCNVCSVDKYASTRILDQSFQANEVRVVVATSVPAC